MARLHYTTDAMPGLRRCRRGRGFTYQDARGRTVRDPATIARIHRLAIPPAYTDVWICADAHGHCRPPVAMRADASSTATTLPGRPSAARASTIA